jgi:hypothetical protein
MQAPGEPALQSASASHWHAPPLHTKPGGHAWPHAPQLEGSASRSLHPAGVWQHVFPAPQAAPPLQEQTDCPPARIQDSAAAQGVALPPDPHEHRPDARQAELLPLTPGPWHSWPLEHPHVFCWAAPPSHSNWLPEPPCRPHALPQPPQWASLAVTFVSHPSSAPEAGIAQLPKPGAQVELQAPFAQLFEATLVPAHARLHCPQWSTLVATFVSQPGIASQSANPGSQASPHAPFEHVADACAAPGHGASHAPHRSGSDAVSASQPSAGSPLQSLKGAAHVPSPQTPPAQAPLACGNEQADAHVPQCAADVCVFASQPSAGSPLQSSKGAAHAVILQVPASHAPAPFAMEQGLSHPPQCSSLSVVSVSQPFWRSPSQSPNPPLHCTSQAPLEHVTVVTFGPSAHSTPHFPHDATLFRAASQPLASSPSQSSKPGSQPAIRHAPSWHAGVACGRSQAMSQPPH